MVYFSNKPVKAAYEASQMVAQQKKAHIIGENLVASAAKVVIRSVFGDKSLKKLNSISLSNN